MSTRGSAELASRKGSDWLGDSLDDYISDICLSRTVGDVVRLMESASNGRTFFVANLVFGAIFETDIGSIEQIVTRIDGTVPDRDNRKAYANIMGDAIDDVLSYGSAYQFKVLPDDPVIIALAKVVVFISTMHTGNNISKKKDKQKAIDMILCRTGGRRTQPVKELTATKYVKPDWMGLPEGE